MRLFTALCFSDENKDSLAHISGMLSGQGKKGRYTKRDNFHLTLNFIGESERADDIINIMRSIKENSFTLKLSGLGCFSGGIIWLGVEECVPLLSIASQLNEGLLNAGFDIEKRKFSPHITLARNFVPESDFSFKNFSVPPINQEVKHVHLMSSEIKNNRRIYTSIYCHKL